MSHGKRLLLKLDVTIMSWRTPQRFFSCLVLDTKRYITLATWQPFISTIPRWLRRLVSSLLAPRFTHPRRTGWWTSESESRASRRGRSCSPWSSSRASAGPKHRRAGAGEAPGRSVDASAAAQLHASTSRCAFASIRRVHAPVAAMGDGLPAHRRPLLDRRRMRTDGRM